MGEPRAGPERSEARREDGRECRGGTNKTPPKTEPGKAGQEPTSKVKYQLDNARCEENVTVHQDPTEPNKPRGIDIFGRLLLLKGSPDGNIMDVFGWPTRPGEVHHEDSSIPRTGGPTR